jgi:hypothetical protein
MDNRGSGIEFSAGSTDFSSPQRPERFQGPLSPLSNRYRGSFPARKAATDHPPPPSAEVKIAWSNTFTSSLAWCLINYRGSQLRLLDATIPSERHNEYPLKSRYTCFWYNSAQRLIASEHYFAFGTNNLGRKKWREKKGRRVRNGRKKRWESRRAGRKK